ncbi:MAG: hypothetical protein LBF02_00730 [Mycoplasmataceae bacterium]|jgi:hypothetical protein|nr:hypothetical protein [Mycoplasmataceae bacterium]
MSKIEKKIGEIKSIDFSDIPNPNDYVNTRVKEKGYKEVIIIISIIIFACAFSVGAYYLVDFLIHKS